MEPWACVVAAYAYPNYRDGLKDGGRLLVIGGSAEALIAARQSASISRDRQTASIETDETGALTTSLFSARPMPADLVSLSWAGWGRAASLTWFWTSRFPGDGCHRRRPGALRAASLCQYADDPTKVAEAYASATRATRFCRAAKSGLPARAAQWDRCTCSGRLCSMPRRKLIVVSDRHERRAAGAHPGALWQA